MKYRIYEKIEAVQEIFYPERIETGIKGLNPPDITSMESGKMDLLNLKETKWNNLISYIPQTNIDELNEKGKTTFTVVTKTTIILEK